MLDPNSTVVPRVDNGGEGKEGKKEIVKNGKRKREKEMNNEIK